jgi:CYTH domain-containing protein
MSQELEIELTFLASYIPDEIKNVEPIFYSDMYIPMESDFAVLRLRKKGDKYEITKKIPVNEGDFSAHTEHTIPLLESEYAALKRSKGKVIEKFRYSVKIEGHRAEVDVFTGGMRGLVLIDFEFSSGVEMSAFVPPACCLIDVTQERVILGGQLAGLNYKDIEGWLTEKEYVSLHA